jgi:hypothetical protein
MADLMAKMGFSFFIGDAERFGLPVGFLRTVNSSSYTYEFDDVTAVSPWTNTMSFQKHELDSVQNMSPALPFEDEPKVAALLEHGHAYYKNAREEVSAPARLLAA